MFVIAKRTLFKWSFYERSKIYNKTHKIWYTKVGKRKKPKMLDMINLWLLQLYTQNITEQCLCLGSECVKK